MVGRLAGLAAAFSVALCAAVIAQTPSPAAGAPPNAAPTLADVHASRLKLPCAACHGDKQPTAVTPEESLATAEQTCLGCHIGGKVLAAALQSKLKNKHVNPHESHLVEIKCVTCHTGHVKAESYCNQCHAFDMPMPPRAER